MWFCSLHGHCCGDQIANDCEGRSCLLSGLPPWSSSWIIYSNFACSLEEYCVNPEAGYFQNAHFHGYKPTCFKIYSTENSMHLNSVNSSICEQFNPHIQCIKRSAKQMSLEHFMFILCFCSCPDNSMIQLICSWNLKSLQFFHSLSFPQDVFESILKILSFTLIAFCHDLQQALMKAG